MKGPHQSHDQPLVGVVVPIFRHSVLLVDAIESVLAQVAPFGIKIVLVNDGCPQKETDVVCRHFARTYPEQITYLRKPNGGLSDARNHCIRHILARLPSVRAVYFLDADNCLRPPALARAFAVLEASAEVGWVYPNIDMFGLSSAHDYGGNYSRLLHSEMNLCEAGSLIRRAVFEAGIVFDTQFKSGFEDWEFFLSAANAGFTGRNLEAFGFLYRKRPESMLAESERDSAGITALLRKKHKASQSPRALIALEQQEMPRLAIVLADIQQVILTTDPACSTERITIDDYIHRYFLAKSNPSRDWAPPYLCLTSSGSFQALAETGLLHATFWKLESLADVSNLGALTAVGLDEDRMGFAVHQNAQGRCSDASFLMIGPTLLRDITFDVATSWIDSLATENPQPNVAMIELNLPQSSFDIRALSRGTAIFDLLGMLRRLRASVWKEGASLRLDWREGDLMRREWSHLILRRQFADEPVYPRVHGGGRDIGLILPIVEFGGVEKVALNFARAIRARGDRPHLFVLNQGNAAISADWRQVLESITFYADPSFGAWGGGAKTYFGTEIPDWADKGNHARAVAMLHWLDGVIEFQGGAFMSVMGKLKRLGIATGSSLHLADLTTAGRPAGNVFLSMAYEHAFNVVAPCSFALADWCHAMGLPKEKIFPVPNAPSFPISANRLAAGLAQKALRNPQQPLRVLYLGRLDAQKGLDRLSEVMQATADDTCEWRVIGKAVVDDGSTQVSPHLLRVLEPALTSEDDLIAAFDWADVLVLLSEYEGLPLTILEAMRQGVVPIATNVGAVGEVVKNARNGFLLPLPNAAADCIVCLRALLSNRETLGHLSKAAARDMVGRDWPQATKAFLDALCDS